MLDTSVEKKSDSFITIECKETIYSIIHNNSSKITEEDMKNLANNFGGRKDMISLDIN